MCFGGSTPSPPPPPPKLPEAPKPPPPPAKPAPPPQPLQPAASQPDLRIGEAKKASSQKNRVSSNSLRGTLNISGNDGGLNK